MSKKFADSFHWCEEHGGAELFMIDDMLAGNCIRRLDPDGAEM